MKVSVIGMGYVGLVTSLCFANGGHELLCIDSDQEKIEHLRCNKAPFFEPNLSLLLSQAISRGNILFSSSYQDAVDFSTVFLLTLPTPQGEKGAADLSILEAAIERLALLVEHDCLIVIKSTVPIGTAKRLEEKIRFIIAQKSSRLKVDLVSVPEFLREGCAIEDFLYPARIVIGGGKPASRALLRELYAPLKIPPERFLWVRSASAELIKYAANAHLAARLSLMNEVARVADLYGEGVSIDEVCRGVALDPRIGPAYLATGIGFGGSCLPKDLQALIAMGDSCNVVMHCVRGILASNDAQKGFFWEKIVTYFSTRGGLSGKKIALWGLSFKPDTDDIRHSIGIEFVHQLLSHGAFVVASDPVAIPSAKKLLSTEDRLVFDEQHCRALSGADALILLTAWPLFLKVSPVIMARAMQEKVIFDGTNSLDCSFFSAHGFELISIGKGSCHPVESFILNNCHEDVVIGEQEVERSLQGAHAAIEKSLHQLVAPPAIPALAPLAMAMRYALFPGGKRLRPLLTLVLVMEWLDGAMPSAASDVAILVELLHTYSLIHDDLPCMDDDKIRRGKPTLHCVFPEAYALLTGDYLLSFAFERAAQISDLTERQSLEIIRVLGKRAGVCGLLGGQLLDMSDTKKDRELLESMHEMKTAALFQASAELAAILVGVSDQEQAWISLLAKKIGIAFQLADDLADDDGEKTTAVTLLGHEATAQWFHNIMAEVFESIKVWRETTGRGVFLERWISYAFAGHIFSVAH